MKRVWLFLAAWGLVVPSMVVARPVSVTVDDSAARAVLTAVRNPRLTFAEALTIAGLPGNQGLIRKSKSYGNPADNNLFARALVAAAQEDAAYVDVSRFQFAAVRKHAAETEQALAELRDPRLQAMNAVKARIARFTPASAVGTVTGYLVVGGTSGGFAFGEPQFYLDLDRYRSAAVASTIMTHELYHSVQALARSAVQAPFNQQKCMKDLGSGGDVADFYDALSAEGTASYVGDILSLPEQGGDEVSVKERSRFLRNLDLVGRSVTQLELSVHGLTTGVAVSPGDIYELGFYGDEVMYALGYVMARAIAKEQGDQAVGELIGLPGAAFVRRYVSLKSYGKSEQVPALGQETLHWANTLSACDGKVFQER
jgi:hypothetical protein